MRPEGARAHFHIGRFRRPFGETSEEGKRAFVPYRALCVLKS